VVESQPSKLLVAGSIPVSRSRVQKAGFQRVSACRAVIRADVAQLVEHSLGKGEVTSSILVIGSRFRALAMQKRFGPCREAIIVEAL
jgi:hypothetical protein